MSFGGFMRRLDNSARTWYIIREETDYGKRFNHCGTVPSANS